MVGDVARGLSLQPFRALRPDVSADRLARLLCPPYDVIDAAERDRLVAADPDNAVAVILPTADPDGYAAAATTLNRWVETGLWRRDAEPALYVYEMRTADGHATRGLVGAVELRDPADGVILPHENTMAGPVADRLAVMTSTGADLEPIYLVYDGGGPASRLVRDIDHHRADVETTTGDGTTHRLWPVRDAASIAAVSDDLATRRAIIADGHHRYATYRERQRRRRAHEGPGPWDRGMALIVDTAEYGPQVEAIHRYLPRRSLSAALSALPPGTARVVAQSPADALRDLPQGPEFAAVLADEHGTVVLHDADSALARRADQPAGSAGPRLDVDILHRVLVSDVWALPDDTETIGYAHSVDEALRRAADHHGFAALLRPTPVHAVAAVAAAGARMPRKSTLFTPKPASGLMVRRLRDQVG